MELTSGQKEVQQIRQKNQIIIEDYTICYHCKTKDLKEEDKYCPNCGFPQRGSDQERRNFRYELNRKNILLSDQKKAIKKAINILFALAGLNFAFGVVLYLVINLNIIEFIASTFLALIYLALALWSKKKPFAGILTGFCVYILTIALQFIADPMTIFHGLLWKILFISAFIYGYKAVKDSEKLEKELKILNTKKN